jgi:hypothetical protein
VAEAAEEARRATEKTNQIESEKAAAAERARIAAEKAAVEKLAGEKAGAELGDAHKMASLTPPSQTANAAKHKGGPARLGQGSLPLKNTLLEPDARLVEAAYQTRLEDAARAAASRVDPAPALDREPSLSAEPLLMRPI